MTGKDSEVIDYIYGQKSFRVFYENFFKLQKLTLPMFFAEGKKYVTIAFGCTGGIHRSVMMADKFYNEISSKDIETFIDHRDLKK